MSTRQGVGVSGCWRDQVCLCSKEYELNKFPWLLSNTNIISIQYMTHDTKNPIYNLGYNRVREALFWDTNKCMILIRCSHIATCMTVWHYLISFFLLSILLVYSYIEEREFGAKRTFIAEFCNKIENNRDTREKRGVLIKNTLFLIDFFFFYYDMLEYPYPLLRSFLAKPWHPKLGVKDQTLGHISAPNILVSDQENISTQHPHQNSCNIGKIKCTSCKSFFFFFLNKGYSFKQKGWKSILKESKKWTH